MPLILGWIVGFVVQTWARHVALGAPLPATLLPLTGMSTLLFSFYMISDPGTTPCEVRAQFAFGAAVAAAYAVLTATHIVFGMFFGLLAVCSLRGLGLWARQVAVSWRDRASAGVRPARVPVPASQPRPQPVEVA